MRADPLLASVLLCTPRESSLLSIRRHSAYPVSSASRSCGHHSRFQEECTPWMEVGIPALGVGVSKNDGAQALFRVRNGVSWPAGGAASKWPTSVHSSRFARVAVVWPAE
jgi:hypothetical protein